MDLLRPSLEEELDELAARVTPHYGVVYDDDAPALYHGGERVELEPQAELAHPVRRLDERPADVAVLYEPFGVGYAAPPRVPDGGRDPRVRDRYHDVSLGRSFLGEQLPHTLARARDLPPVEAESGRAKYTYSKTQSAGRGPSPLRKLCSPESSMTTTSPGATSRRNRAPMISRPQVSLETA